MVCWSHFPLNHLIIFQLRKGDIVAKACAEYCFMHPTVSSTVNVLTTSPSHAAMTWILYGYTAQPARPPSHLYKLLRSHFRFNTQWPLMLEQGLP